MVSAGIEAPSNDIVLLHFSISLPQHDGVSRTTLVHPSTGSVQPEEIPWLGGEADASAQKSPPIVAKPIASSRLGRDGAVLPVSDIGERGKVLWPSNDEGQLRRSFSA